MTAVHGVPIHRHQVHMTLIRGIDAALLICPMCMDLDMLYGGSIRWAVSILLVPCVLLPGTKKAISVQYTNPAHSA